VNSKGAEGESPRRLFCLEKAFETMGIAVPFKWIYNAGCVWMVNKKG
jgi:hypothetical protein